MRDVDGRALHTRSRIKGRYTLERRLSGLLRAVWRFAQGRAVTRDEQEWSMRMIDGLTALLAPSPNRQELDVTRDSAID